MTVKQNLKATSLLFSLVQDVFNCINANERNPYLYYVTKECRYEEIFIVSCKSTPDSPLA